MSNRDVFFNANNKNNCKDFKRQKYKKKLKATYFLKYFSSVKYKIKK